MINRNQREQIMVPLKNMKKQIDNTMKDPHYYK